MLFKIILFLSHGCFAKTKRNLKWEGGWVGERGGCDRCKRSWLWVNCPFAAEESAGQRERHIIPSSSMTILRFKKKKNSGKEIGHISQFQPILKAFHFITAIMSLAPAPRSPDSGTWQSQQPHTVRQPRRVNIRDEQRPSTWTPVLWSFSPVLFDPSPSYSIT